MNPEMAPSDVLAAFTRVRKAAEAHMDELDALGLAWEEETVTNVSVHRGHPVVKVVKFNKIQEGRAIGADYLWWWLDENTGVCFGMLVQAKRLTRNLVRNQMRWTLDVRHNGGQQFRDLLLTANELLVPAMYGVYTGGLVYRAELACIHGTDEAEPDGGSRIVRAGTTPQVRRALAMDGSDHERGPESDESGGQEADCLGCRRMAVSMISAYQLTAVESPADTAGLLLSESVPLEDLVDVDRPAGRVWDRNLHEIAPGPLRSFLVDDQEGPTEVAKKIFKEVCEQRVLAHSQASAVLLEVPGAPLFAHVPEDQGHFPASYYDHFLRGLRVSPPTYVQELLDATSSGTGFGADGQGEAVPRPLELEGIAVDGVVLVAL